MRLLILISVVCNALSEKDINKNLVKCIGELNSIKYLFIIVVIENKSDIKITLNYSPNAKGRVTRRPFYKNIVRHETKTFAITDSTQGYENIPADDTSSAFNRVENSPKDEDTMDEEEVNAEGLTAYDITFYCLFVPESDGDLNWNYVVKHDTEDEPKQWDYHVLRRNKNL